ncbi:MAG: hypothetical protein RI897_3037, partial [Verrucomicrobiota bacterium]
MNRQGAWGWVGSLRCGGLGGHFEGAFASIDEEQHGHADGEAVGDLFENYRAVAIGELAVDLDASVDGAGMHDDGVGFGAFEPFFIQAEQAGVFADAGEHGFALAFVLDAEEVDDIGAFDCVVDVVADAAAEAFEESGDQSAGACESDFGTEFGEAPDIGAGDAAVEDIAEDGDLEALDGAFLLPDGERIEERLGGVFVGAIAGIDDAGIEDAGEEVGCSGGAVTDDEDVGIEGFEIARCIFERFSLFERGGFGGEVDDVGGEAEGGEFERDARPGGGFGKQVDDGFTAQGGDLFDGAFADGLEGGGGIEDGGDFVFGEGLDIEEVFTVPAHAFSRETQSCPSTSSQRTWMRSVLVVGTFFPTKSALMGSSRWPRSMSTASWMQEGRPKSFMASRAARVVRPLQRTSSTRMTVLEVISKGIRVSWTSGATTWVWMSSRCILTSRKPVGTGWFQMGSSSLARREARVTPPRWMPTRATFSPRVLRSAISWAMRVMARAMARESRIRTSA